MISPVAQRQMFQTVNSEAGKSALEVGGLLQRQAGLHQAVLDRMAEAQASVPEVQVTEGLKTGERKGGRQKQGRKGPERQEADPVAEDGANPAETHLDFLA